MADEFVTKVMKGSVTVLATQMKKMVNNKEFGDIKFLVGDQRKVIYAHRCLLSARCEVFRAMFLDQAGLKDDVPFILSEVNPDIFIAVLEYIYTNCCTLNSKNAIDVLASSIEYGMDDLRMMCVRYISESLTVSSACEAMQASVIYAQEDLHHNVLQFIESLTKIRPKPPSNVGKKDKGNAIHIPQDIFQTKGFLEMSEEALSSVLSSDRLNLDEMEIIHGVRNWAQANSVVTGRPPSVVAKKVIQHIRLPLLASDELMKTENENIKDNIIPVDMISFAWKFHALHVGDPGNPWTTLRLGTKRRDTHTYLED